ncbi:FkbM family methyltransferase [Thiorhodococcus minor]|uniref:FkbM family methyltransferase n=1 Tax=Thiorhodococcus minor TaxID=57489 RepID=A0A6M0K8Z6_9GAMM|nr:FkbM family methyltransferase [Thiorhodococcus minor]NEV65157.1 FkbM family methyltransferase [Thiorhodococcus minor]
MDRLYRGFVRPGALVFDVGSHVGDRIASFRRLEARVVAVEPQAALCRVLRLIYGRDPRVDIVTAAVGGATGEAELHVNLLNPTVSTASPAFIEAARSASGWESQVWERRARVLQVSLDDLIAEHGRPAFIKIDVEGREADALAGLSVPVAALSFEFTTLQPELVPHCLERCRDLGPYRFNAALGETQRLVHESWLSAEAMADWVAGLPHAANSGDIYARHKQD